MAQPFRRFGVTCSACGHFAPCTPFAGFTVRYCERTCALFGDGSILTSDTPGSPHLHVTCDTCQCAWLMEVASLEGVRVQRELV